MLIRRANLLPSASNLGSRTSWFWDFCCALRASKSPRWPGADRQARGKRWLGKFRSGHLVNGGESEGTLPPSGILRSYSVGSTHGPNGFEVFCSARSLEPSNGACVQSGASRSNENPAIVCADIGDAKHCRGQLPGSHALACRKLDGHCRRRPAPHNCRLEFRWAFEP